MSRLKGLVARARSVFGARASERRMEEEFAFHVEMEAKRLAAADRLPMDEARRRALVSFGGLDTHREAMRDARGARWFADLGADVRYALRAMRRAPGFAVAVAVTLGVGIGMNGMVFRYVDSLLFRPIPAHEPERLVALFNFDASTRQPAQVAYEDFRDYRDKSGVFDGLAGMIGVPLNVVTGSGTAADMVWGEAVTENFFTVLGMRPALGRLFTADDAPQGANPFAVLSYDAWMKRFGGDSSVVGRAVRINGGTFTILGVAARGFKGMRTFGFWPEIWVPIGMHRTVMPGWSRPLQGRGSGSMMVIGRMKPGLDRARAEADANRFAGQLARAYPATNANISAIVLPAKSGFDNPAYVKPKMLALASALGIFASLVTLAIICANLANLQLARVASRVHEIAIRLSLGCSRARLVRQMLVESAVLALPGVIVAALIVRATPLLESRMLPRLQFRVGMDFSAGQARVVLFSALVALIAVALFGLLPALRASRHSSFVSLAGSRRTTGRAPRRLRGMLVVSQLALSVVLLVGATLFVRSLMVVRGADLGFDPTNRALFSVNLGLQGYDSTRGRAFYDDVLARVRAMPDVASAAWVFPAPFDTYGRSTTLYVDGVPSRATDGTVTIDASAVSETFVQTLGLRMRAGRTFVPADSSGAPLVMVVSRQLAAQFWPGKNPIGQRARRGGVNGPEITVVGVVEDATFETIGPATPARVYLPLRQIYRDWQTLIVYTRGDALTATPRLQRVIGAVDPALPVYGATTMTSNVDGGMSIPRSAASIAGFFGTLALLISSVGLYTVVASGVTERTREIGVRVALGSSPGEVMRLVMRGGAWLGIVGMVLGLAGAAIVARLLGALLYGLSPADPITFALVPIVLGTIVVLATYIPARRAVRLDPMSALRSD